MVSEFVHFALEHPVAVLVGAGILAGFWLIAAFISVMPPLPPGSGWGKQWAYACAQIFGASLDKAGHTVLQTRYAKQIEQQVFSADGSTTKSVETTATTVNPTNQGAPS